MLYFISVFFSSPLTSLMMSVAGMPCTYIMFALVNCSFLGIVLLLVPETGGRLCIQFKREETKERGWCKGGRVGSKILFIEATPTSDFVCVCLLCKKSGQTYYDRCWSV